MVDVHDDGMPSSEKTERVAHAGDDFRNGFSDDFRVAPADLARPPGNRPFSLRTDAAAWLPAIRSVSMIVRRVA
jgi:hypothetical protein